MMAAITSRFVACALLATAFAVPAAAQRAQLTIEQQNALGVLDSLNASASAAVALYECVRQRAANGAGAAG